MVSDLVSTVVVAYNNWPDLELAIQSALCQSHKPVEVIVVDNSSTDATPQAVPARFGDHIRYIRQPNTLDSGAYNTGVRVARGAFVQFLDGDDVLAPYKCEKQLEIFRADPSVDVVFGDVRCFHTLPGPARSLETAQRDQDDMLKACLARYGSGMIPMVGMLFRSSALKRVGMFDETLYNADIDYELRALWAGCRFRFCPGNPLAFYRIRPDQMSANSAAMAQGSEAVWNKALGYVTAEPYQSMVKACLAWGRFLSAMRKDGMTTRQALAKLAEARETCANTVPLLAYVIGMGVILIPYGGILADSPLFRGVRRFVARLAGCQPYWES